MYEELGVRTIINAAGTVTRFGGSLMAPEVVEAMRVASQEFCVLEELHAKVGERIASMLEVEAAYVTSSASCAIVLTVAACMAGADPERIQQLPDTTGMRREVVIQSLHRIAYDQAIRLAGAELVVIADGGTPPREVMRAAIGEHTAGVFFMATAMFQDASVPLEEVVAMAHAEGVPVIVDAASECPPLSTLTRFNRAGADLVIFSGGKSIQGPQSTGLVIGRKDLVAACAANGNPFAAVGRPMKVSREEVIGFMRALELYLERDHDADQVGWLGQLDYIEGELRDLPNVVFERLIKSETYAVPLLSIRPEASVGMTTEELADALQAGAPSVVVAQHFTDDGIAINPHNLKPGQERIVAQRLREVLSARH